MPDPKQMACPCCGESQLDSRLLGMLELVEARVGQLFITSGYRCPIHNAKVGGAPLSEHKLGKAVDISVHNLDRVQFYEVCRTVGLTGFGFGQTFLHVDVGRRRRWNYGPKSRSAWNGLAG